MREKCWLDRCGRLAVLAIMAVFIIVAMAGQGYCSFSAPALGPVTNISLVATPTPTPAISQYQVRPPAISILTNNTTTPTPVPNYNLSLSGRLDTGMIVQPADGFYTDSPLIYVTNGSQITVFEVNTNKVIDTIRLDSGEICSVAVTPDYRTLYVLYKDWDDAAMEAGNTNAWFIYVLAMDLKTKQVIADTRYTGTPGGSMAHDIQAGSPERLLLSPDGRYLYVSVNCYNTGLLYRYDTASHKYTGHILTWDLYESMYHWNSNIRDPSISKDGRYLYYADPDDEILTILNLPDMTLRGGYYLPRHNMQPLTLAVKSDESCFYSTGPRTYYDWCLDAIDPAHYKYDPQNNDFMGAMVENLSSSVDRIVLSQDERYLLLLHPTENRVVKYAPGAPLAQGVYQTGNKPSDMALSPDGTRLYVLNDDDGTMTVIDLSTGTGLPGSPVTVAIPKWNGYNSNRLFPLQMTVGPVPEHSVFINTSAQKRKPVSAGFGSVKQVPATSTAPNVQAGRAVSASRDPVSGQIVFVPVINNSTPTASPGRLRGNLTVISPGLIPENDTPTPVPNTQVGTPTPGTAAGTVTGDAGSQATQSETPSQENSSSTPATAASPGTLPGNATHPAVVTIPGFGLLICMVSLAAVAVMLRRSRR